MSRRRVVVTGMGALTPIGNDVETFWDSLVNGRSGIGPITQFDATRHATRIAGEVVNFDPETVLDRKEVRRNDPFTHFAVGAAKEAVTGAGISLDCIDAERMGVIWGSGIGGIQTHEQQAAVLNAKGPDRISPFYVPMMISDMAAGMISMKFGAKGPNYGTVSACASAAHAIGEAARKIQYGEADIMIGGGSEAPISPIAVGGFCSLRALSRRNDDPSRASRPFDAERDGFVMGEGAGGLVLEELEHARGRTATIMAEFRGLGFTADAYHQTDMPIGGEGGARAMRLALKDAAIAPSDVGYVNAHGTSTPVGDPQETAAIKIVFGDHAEKGGLAVSSTKSMTGHLLGAAGAIESVACIRALTHGVLPPTTNYENPDPACDLDYLPNQAREQQVQFVLNNSFGFGGHNVALIFGRFLD